jgi:hypothetical protein
MKRLTGDAYFTPQPWVSAGNIVTVDSSSLADPATGMLGLFDTLQEIYLNDHELLDPAC